MYSGHFDPVAYSAAYATGRERMLEPRYGYPPSRRRVAAGDALAGVRERFFETLLVQVISSSSSDKFQ